MIVTKTDLLKLRQCPNWFWLRKHEPESLVGETLGLAQIEEGNNYELTVRRDFTDGVLVGGELAEAVERTKQLIASEVEVIFQATFEHDGFVVKADVLKQNAEQGGWNLNEIKASTELKDEYLVDIAIQRAILIDAGVDLKKCILIHLNSRYVRSGDVDLNQLVIRQDVTAQARAMEAIEVRPLLQQAKEILASDEIPVTNMDKLTCDPSQCPCAAVSYNDLPEYSVFDLTRLKREQCSRLIKKGIRDLTDIQNRHIKLSQPQKNQIECTRSEQPIIDVAGIEAELRELQFPLYFLDYETFNFAVPKLDGFLPFQHLVFQFSLHVLPSPDGELEHHECLLDEIKVEACQELASQLKNAIGEEGSVVVWHRSFEEYRNNELGDLFPKFRDFFRSLNRRVYDLEDIFKQQLCVDHRFRGRTSIKNILPVLCPAFSYADLDIKNGSEAMETWYRLIPDNFDGNTQDHKKQHLLEYCKLDTLAMVEIYRVLHRSIVDASKDEG